MRKVCLLLLIMGIIFCGCSGNGKTAKAQDDNDSVLDDTTVVDVVDTTSYVSESDETGGRVVAPSPVVSTDEDDDNEDEVRDVTTTDGDAVYICTGGYSKRYHFDRFCSGLSNCRGEIEAVSVEEAEDEGRTPCHKCAY